MIETAAYIVDTLSQRRGGIYYTPPIAAQVMADWAIRSDNTRVLEPCFGSGVFLAAIKQISTYRHYSRVKIHGIELMEAAHRMAIEANLIEEQQAVLGDFLNVNPFPVDVIIGNPPYIRLRALPKDQINQALKLTKETLGIPMETSGSVWMAFVIHAVRFVKKSGRMALVLPYEFTYVRYAKPLWKFLGDNFGSLRIVRVKERLFPDIMQEAIILFADNYGSTSNNVNFEVYQTTKSLSENNPIVQKYLSLNEIINGGRPFLKALLSDELTHLLEYRLTSLTTPVSKICSFNIGYVSGNKKFFHPDQQTITNFKLPISSLRGTVTASRELSNIGIRTSSMCTHNIRKLFYPNNDLLPEDILYIENGERDKVNLGYKCRNRIPWYKVPDVRIPNFILSVFKETPTLVLNDSGLVASNSLLCGFLHAGYTAEQFLASWYTSLTLLYCELRVHSLGGGVLVFIPGEVATIRMPTSDLLPTTHIKELDKSLRSVGGNPYQIGDEPILIKSLKLTIHEVELIKEGVQLLYNWRNAKNKT